MWIGTLSLLPEIFTALQVGVVGRAIDDQRITLQHFNIRDFTSDLRKTVDDRPFGGGPGMVMKVTPLRECIKAARKAAPPNTPVIHLSPQGKKFDQKTAIKYSELPGVILVASRYEGIDARLVELDIDEELSIGDYVMSGGEIAACVVIDTITRLLPGVLGHEESAQQDSFMNGLLDYPHYTRPEEIEGQCVPEVLLSGNHQVIAEWRLQQALGQTYLKRPDLLAEKPLLEHEQHLLNEFLRVRGKRDE